MRRHTDALAISAGAVNPLAIANSIARGLNEIREQPGGWSTDDMCRDPAIKLMVSQLAYITGVWGGVTNFAKAPDYRECGVICREADLMDVAVDTEADMSAYGRAVAVLDREEA